MFQGTITLTLRIKGRKFPRKVNQADGMQAGNGQRTGQTVNKTIYQAGTEQAESEMRKQKLWKVTGV